MPSSSSSSSHPALTSTAFSSKPPPPEVGRPNEQQPSGESDDLEEEDDDDDDTKPERQQQSARAKGNKRSLGANHHKDEKTLSEKKLRRLEKNRLSARECRRRKREATENLERQINVLEGENLRLRLQLQIGKEAEESRSRDQEKLTHEIDDLLKSGASEADIFLQLEEFKEKHADYGKSRRSAIEFHLRNIERLLMPTQTTSFVLHAIQEGLGQTEPATSSEPAGANVTTSTAAGIKVESSSLQPPYPSSNTARKGISLESAAGMSTSIEREFAPNESLAPVAPVVASSGQVMNSPSASAMDPKDLFLYLVNYLEVTPEQATALKDSRFVAQELDGCLETALSVLGELRERLAQTGDDLETEFNNVRSILTPTQAAKFLVWVAHNSACMHMLNELWDRVYGTCPPIEAAAPNDESSP